MLFNDFFIYYYAVKKLAVVTNSYCYSSLFTLLFYPLTFLDVNIALTIYVIFYALAFVKTIHYLVQHHLPKWLIFIMIFKIVDCENFNADIFFCYFVLRFWNFEQDFKHGFLLGCLVFKPLGLYAVVLLLCKKRNLKFIGGIGLGLIISWFALFLLILNNYMRLFDFILELYHLGINTNETLGVRFYLGLHYPWIYYCLYNLIHLSILKYKLKLKRKTTIRLNLLYYYNFK